MVEQKYIDAIDSIVTLNKLIGISSLYSKHSPETSRFKGYGLVYKFGFFHYSTFYMHYDEKPINDKSHIFVQFYLNEFRNTEVIKVIKCYWDKYFVNNPGKSKFESDKEAFSVILYFYDKHLFDDFFFNHVMPVAENFS